MKLPLGIAKKLHTLKETHTLPSSSFNRELAGELMADGILIKIPLGRTKSQFSLTQPALLDEYLKNKYGIHNLQTYIAGLENEELLGHEAVTISSDSKIRRIRTFKGFLVNSYEAIPCMLNGEKMVCLPQEGTFLFIQDFENFTVPEDVLVVGVENAENFRLIRQQAHLFPKKVLFVCRYPQSGDLVTWLQSIPNCYLHFGDFDFAGIKIYLSEFKKYLGEKASFFVPENIKELLQNFGSRDLYNKQHHFRDSILIPEEIKLSNLIALIDETKKGLEQQILIKGSMK